MSMPAWLEPLPDAEAMRATDRWAIEEVGIPSEQLMERAGEGLARLAGNTAPDGCVAIVCGKGNNGGDGLVAARVLRGAGREVRTLLLGDPDEFEGDAAANLGRLREQAAATAGAGAPGGGAGGEPVPAGGPSGAPGGGGGGLGPGVGGEPRGPRPGG